MVSDKEKGRATFVNCGRRNRSNRRAGTIFKQPGGRSIPSLIHELIGVLGKSTGIVACGEKEEIVGKAKQKKKFGG